MRQDRIPFRDVAKELDVSWDTVYRWHTVGRKSRSKKVVKMQARNGSDSMWTTWAWYDQFIAALDE